VRVTDDRVEPEHLVRALAARSDPDQDPVRSLCLTCSDVLGVAGAGLMLGSRGRALDYVGVSDHVSEALEQVEFTLGEGPCVAAFRSKEPMFDPDLAADDDTPWTEFRRAALAVGVRAAFGFPLLVDQVCIGALNLYHDQSGALTDEQVGDALVVAQFAGRTLLEWQADAPPGMVAWQLEKVPEHRMEVHQATGRISVQAGISLADALVFLRAYAFAEDRPLADIAADVAAERVRFD
jgi:hypothetical protein